MKKMMNKLNISNNSEKNNNYIFQHLLYRLSFEVFERKTQFFKMK